MRLRIALSFLIAFFLLAVPIGFQWNWLRPELTALLVIYWCIYAPQQFGLTSAWCVGLLQDVIDMSPFGYHSLCLLLTAYLTHLICTRIHLQPLWQQTLWVCLLMCTYQLIAGWLGAMIGRTSHVSIILATLVSSALLWPLLSLGAQYLKHKKITA